MKKLSLIATIMLAACAQQHKPPVITSYPSTAWHWEGKGKTKAQASRDEDACLYQSHLATAAYGDTSWGITQSFRLEIECMANRGYHRAAGR